MKVVKLNWILKKVIQGGLSLLAKAQATAFGNVGAYVGDQGADIANASLGMSMVQARIIITPIVSLAMGGDPDPAVVDEMAKHFVNRTVIEQAVMTTNAPDTLFVFAAGNDGTNNDEFPVSPANIKADNTISVAATTGRQAMAPFSNFGQMVDVAAPGVSILSAVPSDLYLELSGTSQAAPYVAQVAGVIKDANPLLSPGEIKKIILGTVDRKAFLKDIVLSEGIANIQRAAFAAEASTYMNLEDAISESLNSVDDVEEFEILSNIPRSLPFPLPAIF